MKYAVRINALNRGIFLFLYSTRLQTFWFINEFSGTRSLTELLIFPVLHVAFYILNKIHRQRFCRTYYLLILLI